MSKGKDYLGGLGGLGLLEMLGGGNLGLGGLLPGMMAGTLPGAIGGLGGLGVLPSLALTAMLNKQKAAKPDADPSAPAPLPSRASSMVTTSMPRRPSGYGAVSDRDALLLQTALRNGLLSGAMPSGYGQASDFDMRFR